MRPDRALWALLFVLATLNLGFTPALAQQVNPSAWQGTWTGNWAGNGDKWSFSLKDVQPGGRAIFVDQFGEHEVQISGDTFFVHRKYIDDEFRLNANGTLSGKRDSQARGSYGKGSVYTITMTKSAQ